jgi:hypothetical protein
MKINPRNYPFVAVLRSSYEIPKAMSALGMYSAFLLYLYLMKPSASSATHKFERICDFSGVRLFFHAVHTEV